MRRIQKRDAMRRVNSMLFFYRHLPFSRWEVVLQGFALPLCCVSLVADRSGLAESVLLATIILTAALWNAVRRSAVALKALPANAAQAVLPPIAHLSIVLALSIGSIAYDYRNPLPVRYWGSDDFTMYLDVKDSYLSLATDGIPTVTSPSGVSITPTAHYTLPLVGWQFYNPYEARAGNANTKGFAEWQARRAFAYAYDPEITLPAADFYGSRALMSWDDFRGAGLHAPVLFGCAGWSIAIGVLVAWIVTRAGRPSRIRTVSCWIGGLALLYLPAGGGAGWLIVHGFTGLPPWLGLGAASLAIIAVITRCFVLAIRTEAVPRAGMAAAHPASGRVVETRPVVPGGSRALLDQLSFTYRNPPFSQWEIVLRGFLLPYVCVSLILYLGYAPQSLVLASLLLCVALWSAVRRTARANSHLPIQSSSSALPLAAHAVAIVAVVLFLLGNRASPPLSYFGWRAVGGHHTNSLEMNDAYLALATHAIPTITGPGGESVVPTPRYTVPLLGWTFYNPFEIGKQNTFEFGAWQATRAFSFVYDDSVDHLPRRSRPSQYIEETITLIHFAELQAAGIRTHNLFGNGGWSVAFGVFSAWLLTYRNGMSRIGIAICCLAFVTFFYIGGGIGWLIVHAFTWSPPWLGMLVGAAAILAAIARCFTLAAHVEVVPRLATAH